jgi:hypothetical protein
MNPSDLSRELKRIAATIEASKSPSKDLVIRDLKNLVSKIAGKEETLDQKMSRLKILGPKFQGQEKEVVDAFKELPQGLKALENLVKTMESRVKAGGSEESGGSEE